MELDVAKSLFDRRQAAVACLIVFLDTEHFNTEIFIYKKRGTVVTIRDLKPLAALHYSAELLIARTWRSLPRILRGLCVGGSLSPTLNAET